MKRFITPALAFLLLSSLGLAGCSKGKSNEAKPQPNDLTGTWKLISRQCYCAPAPTPNETATFTATSYSFYKNGQLASSGAYTYAAGPICGITSSVPTLALAQSTTVMRYATYTLSGSQLVLDYGSPCDAARDTYEWVQ